MEIEFCGKRSGKSSKIIEIFENEPGLMWLIEPDGIIVRFNKDHPILGKIHFQAQKKVQDDKDLMGWPQYQEWCDLDDFKLDGGDVK